MSGVAFFTVDLLSRDRGYPTELLLGHATSAGGIMERSSLCCRKGEVRKAILFSECRATITPGGLGLKVC